MLCNSCLYRDERARAGSFLPALLSCALLLLPASLLPGVAHAESSRTLEDVEQQIHDTTARLKALSDEIASSKALKSELQKALEAAQSQVGEREERLQGLDKEIARFDDKLNSLNTMIGEAREGVQARQLQLSQALRNAQLIGQQTALKIVLQNDDPALADRLSIYTEHVLSAQNAAIREQVSVLNTISDAHANALKDRNWLNYIKKKASQQRENYASTATSKQTTLGEVEAGLDQKTRSVAQLKADQARLQGLMDELETLQSTQSGYFIDGKGKYPAPVAGELFARFGDIKSVGKLRWSGLFIKASQGKAVHAVADGEVIYSDFLQGFGMLVIIDHGDGYTSLYGGNRKVAATIGQWVESGATIATVGDSGGQNVSGVYFEIRHNAKAVNPEEWLSADFQVAISQ
ncbi:murein hydrolase activator EnvC family protein [Granulosicoccus antarcticus]|uniref:Murein hydrolase activator EnvC n=1 Tax=Granulosicoccus antarcticus IMCC3135 TaxID=1192854 RepID=A0A2Z2NZ16_9GAMM|nr:peptidoglycan DD-metalloendopeptidase family protein [Granulosicoccus antarcticus]ASJ76692.1 Murein hydrolase activator EnvC [Granulosicoccus antarcticus IMCC3135]